MPETSFFHVQDGSRQLVRRFKPKGTPLGAVCLVHGIGEHSGRYVHVAQRIREAGFEAYSYDLRGFGASDGRRAYVAHFSQFLDDLGEHLQALSTEPVILYGHSMGGLIALMYALDKREPRPKALVLSAPAIAAEAPAWQRAFAPMLARTLPFLPVPTPIDLSQLSSDPAVGEAYAQDPLVQRRATTRLGDEIFRAMEWTREALLGLDLPTLLVHGGDDTLVPTRSTEVAGALAGVERIVYTGFRHELHNEPARARVFDDMVRFLRTHAGVAGRAAGSEVSG